MLTVTSPNNVTYAAIADVPRKQSINGEREITIYRHDDETFKDVMMSDVWTEQVEEDTI